MSTQPLQMPKTQAQEAERRKAGRRSDRMYFSGAALVTAGAALFRVHYGLIAAGLFLLLPPMLELASSFLRGLRLRSR
jgi:UPF0716 family protein affecting phage T7 exclusion